MFFSKNEKKKIQFGYFDQTASQAPPPRFWSLPPKLVFLTFQMISSKTKINYIIKKKIGPTKFLIFFLGCRVWR